MASVIIVLKPYILPVIVGCIAIAVGAVLVTATVKMIVRQIKLYNSITLVELKRSKLRYWVIILILGILLFFVVAQMFDRYGPEKMLMEAKFNMKNWQCNLMLGGIVMLLVLCEFFVVVLTLSKSAVIDKGIYTNFKFLDWYHVHDYIIDEVKCVVILSSNKFTFQTLSGTTPPLKVNKEDIPKLKFILNKNKNKFSAGDK